MKKNTKPCSKPHRVIPEDPVENDSPKASQKSHGRSGGLKESDSELLRILPLFTADWVFVLNPDGALFYSSPSSETITGYPPETFTENPAFFLSIVHPDDRQRLEDHICTELSTRNMSRIEYRISTRQGDVVWLEHVCRPIHGEDGRYMGRIVNNHDITERKLNEEIIRGLSKFLSENPSPVLRLDRKGVILYANEASLPLLQLWKSSIGKKAPKYLRTLVIEALSTQSKNTLEIDLDGRTFMFTLVPIVDSGFVNIYGVDITERKNMEKSMSESEENFRFILTSMVDFVFVFDKSDRFSFCHAHSQKDLLAPIETFIGKHYSEILPPDISSKVSQALDENRKGLFSEFDYQIEVGSRKLWYSSRQSPIISGGIYRGALAIVRDITERKKVEETLRQSEEKYRHLFEAESDAIFLIDNTTGRILQVNHAASIMYGYSREELLAMKNIDLSAEPEQTQQVTRETPVKIDIVVNIPLRYHRKKNGDIFPVEITGRFFELEGRPVHIAAIRDITARKLIEEEREHLIIELKDALAEIKTLKGFLPICSYCKKIRNDQGYWEQIELYIKKHSEAEFSHSICPECMKKYYPDIGNDEQE